jgi:hypothetical protein
VNTDVIPATVLNTSKHAARSDAHGKQILAELNAMDPTSQAFKAATKEIADHLHPSMNSAAIPDREL